jgi:hypothetical protein
VSIVRDTVEVIRALRDEPSTVIELGRKTGLHWRKVYRLLDELRQLGAPLRESEDRVERAGHGGSVPKRFSLTAAGLASWLTPSTK